MRTGNYILYTVYATDNKYSESSKRLLYSPIASQHGYTIINPKITMEINKVGSFEFTLPKTNPEFDYVKSMETCIIVEQNYEDNYQQIAKEVWRGRVISRELDFYSNAQIICEGILGALRDHIIVGGMKSLTSSVGEEGIKLPYILRILANCQTGAGGYYRYTGNQGREIDLHPSYNLYLNSSSPVITGEGAFKIEPYEETDSITCLDALNMLLEKYPIFLRYKDTGYDENDYHPFSITPMSIFYSAFDDHDYISNQQIEFGSNLIDLSEMIDFSSIYTLMWAFGKENKSGVKLDLSSQAGYSDSTYQIPSSLITGLTFGTTYHGPLIHKELVNLYGYIEKVMDFPEASTAQDLREKAIAKFSKDIDYAVQINLKAVDLSLVNVDYNEFQVGDFVRVISIPHGINTNTICSKIVLDLESPSNNEYTFGLNFKSLTDRQVKTDKQNAQLYDAAKNSVYQEKEES